MHDKLHLTADVRLLSCRALSFSLAAANKQQQNRSHLDVSTDTNMHIYFWRPHNCSSYLLPPVGTQMKQPSATAHIDWRLDVPNTYAIFLSTICLGLVWAGGIRGGAGLGTVLTWLDQALCSVATGIKQPWVK
jgi:hypothetical protein